MINTSAHNKKLLFILITCIILFFAIFTGISSSQSIESQENPYNSILLSINDGYLYDYNENDRESVRAIDYSIASPEIPANATVESELLIANYGVDTEDISLEPHITYRTGQNEGDVVDTDEYEVQPKSQYDDVTLNVGEHKLYTFDFKFLESGSEYTVSFINSDAPNEKPIVSKDINIVEEGSGASDSLILEKEKLTQDKITITRFKDENSFRSSAAGSSTSLPPVETNDDGDIIQSDVAEGRVSDFGNIRSNSDIYGSIINDNGEINVGFSAENVPNEEHYAISTLYELENIDSVEMNIVSSTGEEIDEHTDYYLSNENSVNDIVFQLSNEEISYIQSQGEVYFTFDNVEETQNDVEIKLYEMKVIALNEVWNIPEPEISADLTAEPDSAEVGDTVQITAEITNEGSVSINEDFRLRETEALETSQTVSVSDGEIINPGDTVTQTFNVPVTTANVHEFELFGSTVNVDVAESGEGAIRPTISTNLDVVGTGDSIQFSIDNVDNDDFDRINEFEWRFGSDEDYTNTNEENVQHQFDESGSHSVTLKTEYEDDEGNVQTHRTQTVVDVIQGPEFDVGAVQYDFTVNNQEMRGEQAGSSLTGDLISGTCANNCVASFSFDGIGLTVSQGINMIVFETERDGHQYHPIHYGTYDVVNDEYAYTTSVSSSTMTQMSETMSNGGASGASQALIDDINDLEGEDRYFVFVGGGNPAPQQNSNEVFNTLSNIGANLDGSGELGENSMWTFATQTLSNGDVTPLHESYIPAESGEKSITEEYKLEPYDITEDAQPSPNRPVHYDIDNIQIAGSLDDSVIVWTMDDGTIIDDEIYTSEIYTSESEYDVSVLVEDELGLEETRSRFIETNTINPVANIPELNPIVDESDFLYATGSYDSDSTISNYQWIIPTLDEENDEETIYNSPAPEHDWESSGFYDVELVVTDNYGNTDTTTETIQVLGAPPTSDADITRVISNFQPYENNNIDNILSNEPILYYPLDFGDGITEEFSQSNDGIINGELNRVEGVVEDEYALEFTEQSSIDVPDIDAFSEQMSMSMWIKTEDTGMLYQSQNDEFTLRNSNVESDFVINSGDESIELDFESDISTGEWTHIAASYDVVDGMNLYVNGELDNSNDNTIGQLNINSAQIGSEFDGHISDIQIYDMRLNEEDASNIYNNNGQSMITKNYQGVFYEFGTEYKDINRVSEGGGTVDLNFDHFNIIADSMITGSDSAQTIEIEDVDNSKYDTLYMSYDAEFVRQVSSGDDITGVISIESGGEESRYIVDNHMHSFENGILELDVSDIDDIQEVTISAESYGSNLGRTSLEVYEVWGTTDNKENPSRTDLYDEIYPDIISNMNVHETRNGIRFAQKDVSAQNPADMGENGIQHNIIPAMNALSLDINYDIRTDTSTGVNLYGDRSGGYTLGTGAVDPESVLCIGSTLLDNACDDIDEGDKTIDEGPYSHAGLEIAAMNNNHVTVESLNINAETTDTRNPTLNFDASASEGSESGIYIKEYEWDLNTDTSFRADYVGEELTHTFNELGTHEVALRTTDTFGESNIETFEFEVTNLKPSISPQFTSEADLGESATFETQTNAPGEADIEQVIWDMGDGNFETGRSISYEYETAGEYDVTVVAIDEAGLTVSDTDSITISGEDPDLDGITTSATAHVMDTVLFDTSGDGFDNLDSDEHPLQVQNRVSLTDAEDPNGGELQFDWIFPDTTLANVDNPHTIVAEEGEYQYTVQATNAEGRTSSETIDLDVTNQGPEINMNIEALIEFDDEGNMILNDEYNGGDEIDDIEDIEDIEERNVDGVTYVTVPINVEVNAYHFHPRIGGDLTVDMGDGNIMNHDVPEDTTTSYTYEFEHEFDVPAEDYQKEDFPVNFDIEAQIVDDFGAEAEDSKTIDVELREISTNLLINPRQAVIFQDELEFQPVNVNNPDSDIDVYEYDFDNGDVTERSNANAVRKEYFREGTYQPTLTIEDEYGQTDTAIEQIRIMVDFDDVLFLACGIDEGRNGPSLSQCEDEYSGTQLDGWIEMDNNDGIQQWTVPQTGIYELTAAGAEGGGAHGGDGAAITIRKQLDRGDELRILAGLMGSVDSSTFTAGGGGTFVATPDDEPIVVAGGGGAATKSGHNQDASLDRDGNHAYSRNGCGDAGTPGTNGGGGTVGGGGFDVAGGGGFYEAGGQDSPGDVREGGHAFIDGGLGGAGSAEGGFGGGGASSQVSCDRTGGGGGYSGGAAARAGSGGNNAAAGGGGSYIPDDVFQVIFTGHYSDLDVPSEVTYAGTGYLDVDIFDMPETELELIENNNNVQQIINDGDTISSDSIIELNADYTEGLSDAPEITREWYISDGSQYTADTETHQFDEDGEYTITAESIDENGIPISQDTVAITVGEPDEDRYELQSSCQEILSDNPSSNSGVYVIEPVDGETTSVYCDMETDGGGWTLVSSTTGADDSSQFHYNGGDWTGGDSNINYDERSTIYNQYVNSEPVGDVFSRTEQDTVLPSYYQVSFDEMMFADDANNYISYNGMSGPDVSTWFDNLDGTVDPNAEENLVGSCNSNDCENTIDDSFEPSATNLDSSVNNNNRLTIRFKSEDGDTGLGGDNNHWKYGPTWDWERNNNVNWDEGGFGWASAAESDGGSHISTRGLGGTQADHNAEYIFWYVR